MWDGFYSCAGNGAGDKERHVPALGIRPEVSDRPNYFNVGINPSTLVNIPQALKSHKLFIVAAGMGDIAWIYSKLSCLDEPFILAVTGGATSEKDFTISLRSTPFLSLLPKLTYYTVAFCGSEQVYKACMFSNLSNCKLPTSPAYLCFNHLLEKGIKLNDVLPMFRTDKHFEVIKPEWAETEADLFLKDEPSFCIYTSSMSYYSGQNLSPENWVGLITSIANDYPDHKIVILGSPWDWNMMIPVYDSLCAIGYSERVTLLHDRHIAVTLAVLRRCNFFVSCVSGISIIAEYQRVPTVHLYPRHLHSHFKLMGTWESEEMVASGKSLSLKIEIGYKNICKELSKLTKRETSLELHSV